MSPGKSAGQCRLKFGVSEYSSDKEAAPLWLVIVHLQSERSRCPAGPRSRLDPEKCRVIMASLLKHDFHMHGKSAGSIDRFMTLQRLLQVSANRVLPVG